MINISVEICNIDIYKFWQFWKNKVTEVDSIPVPEHGLSSTLDR